MESDEVKPQPTAFEQVDQLAGGLYRLVITKRGDGPHAWRIVIEGHPKLRGFFSGATLEEACQELLGYA